MNTGAIFEIRIRPCSPFSQQYFLCVVDASCQPRSAGIVPYNMMPILSAYVRLEIQFSIQQQLESFNLSYKDTRTRYCMCWRISRNLVVHNFVADLKNPFDSPPTTPSMHTRPDPYHLQRTRPQTRHSQTWFFRQSNRYQRRHSHSRGIN